jgi:NADPH2:quinone reductase
MNNSKMRSAWFESFGEAIDTLKVGKLEKPEPQAGEVLVRLATSGVNPSDVKKRAGAFPNLLDDGLVIPHSDGAGTIEAVGEGVSPQRIGDRVWVYQAQYGRRFGTAAEYVAVDDSRAPTLPDNTSFEIGACLGIPVMTAHRCVFTDGSVEGQTILVTGGAGRVGYYAIQWAKQAGARVITTASNDADKATCLSIGADCVVNHRQENWSESILTYTKGEKVDRVIDVEFGANLPEVLKVIKTSGTIATYSSTQVKEPQLPFVQMMFLDLTLRMVIVYAIPEEAKQAAIADIYEKLENNEFQHRVAHVLPLEEIAKSHELIEQGGFGGCVVVVLQSK